MDMMKDPAGYGIGFPWHYFYALIILAFVVLLIVKLVKYKKTRQ
jgi:hypothetical protein